MKKMAIKGLVTLAAVVALCMFFSGTIKTISTAKVKLVTAKQGKLEEEINLTFPETEDVKLALASDQSVTIKRVRVAKGRRVAAGDVLFEAEVSGYDKEMESLRGEYDAAQKELMELTGLKSYPAGLTMTAARRVTDRFCQSAIQLVLDTDLAMKTSAGEQEQLLELLLVRLAQEAQHG